MIMSFSVPDSPKFRKLIEWYTNADKQERSRDFRNIFMSYLDKPHHTMESTASSRVSRRPEEIELVRMNVVSNEEEDDLDSRLDLIGTSLQN